MHGIRIELGKGHGFENHAGELDAMARAAIPNGFVGLSCYEDSVNLFVEDFIRADYEYVATLIEQIRTFQPTEEEAKPPEPSVQELLGRVAELEKGKDDIQRQLNELRAVVNKK